jgi:hemolysin III
MKLFNKNSTLTGIKSAATPRAQGLGEEIANSIVHGIGAGLSITALALLVVFSARTGDAWRIVSSSIYGSTLVFLYMSSTMYHGLAHPGAKRLFKIFDHASIFLLIAGTYTPIALVTLRGPWGWTIFGLIWAMAIGGILAKIFFIGKFKGLSVAIYIAMGWLIVIAINPLLKVAPPGLMTWMLIGGLCYTFGVIFYALKKPLYFHFVWHLFVLAGSICHFFGILFYVSR